MMTTVRSKSNNSNQVGTVEWGGNWAVRLFDSLFVLRPTLMFPLWTMTLCGHHLSNSNEALSGTQWWLLSVSLSALFGLVYLLNQFRDRESDRLNGKLHLVSSGIMSRRWLIAEMIILDIIVLVGIFYAGFAHIYLMIILIFVIAGILYNYTPLALEQRPIGGLLSGIVGGWLLLHLGGMIAGETAVWWREVPYVIAFSAACLLTGLLDRNGDEQAGKMTFTVVYGTQATIVAGLIGFVITGIWGAYNLDLVVLVPVVGSLPIMILSWKRKSINLAVQANKVAIFLLSVMVGVYYPVYLIVIVLYYSFARWYHRQRFGMGYPNFKAE